MYMGGRRSSTKRQARIYDKAVQSSQTGDWTRIEIVRHYPKGERVSWYEFIQKFTSISEFDQMQLINTDTTTMNHLLRKFGKHVIKNSFVYIEEETVPLSAQKGFAGSEANGNND